MKKNSSVENNIGFMRLLTFTGGFLNAYSYYNRGGVFTTFHTGNLVRIGLSMAEKNMSMFIAALLPVLAASLGAFASNILKDRIDGELDKKLILAELVLLVFFSFFLSDSMDGLVVFGLSFIAMFQLSNFRKINSGVHASAIMTGNLRTLMDHFTRFFLERTRENFNSLLSYFLNFFSFVLGVAVGGILSFRFNKISIFFCIGLLAIKYVSYFYCDKESLLSIR